jgi:hypothetical protein
MNAPTYVYDENIEKLETEVGRLNRRAAKLGLPAIQLRIGAIEKVSAGVPEAVHKRAEVSLVGDAPKLAGWTFMATVDHLSNGLITSYPGCSLDLRPFRGTDATCDHCQVNRKRHETFIVQKNDSTVKRVGRTCLKDFMGSHGNPAALIGHLNLWGKAFEALEGAEAAGVGTATHTLELQVFLGYVAQEMRERGWLSRGKAYESGGEATADRAQGAYWSRGTSAYTQRQPTPEDELRGKKAVVWAQALTDKEVEDNDYLYNLRAVCQDVYIRPKRGGLAGSVIVAAERAFAKANDIQRSNLHIGLVKERLTLGLTLVDFRETGSFYGVSYLHRFEDAAGNCLIWFANNPEFVRDGSNKRRMVVGETLTLAGTVKKHDDFKGRLQTNLNRVSHPKEK